MRRIIAVAGLCALALTTHSWADDKAPAVTDPTAKLIERLASPDYKVRESATKALEERGVELLPELRKALDGEHPAEARKRIAALVERFERLRILSPRRITLSLKDRPVAEAIKEIAKQTGYAIQYQGNRNVLITIDFKNATFWEAMDYICTMAGLVMHHNEGQGLVLYQNEGYWPYVYYDGPFKVVANNFNYNKTFNFGPLQRNPAANQLRSESLTFSFTLHSEPKLPLMSVSTPRIIEATDDMGMSMKPETNPHEVAYQHNYSGYRTYQYGSSLILSWPNKEARTVKRLRGLIPVTLLGEQKPEVTIPDILKAKGKKVTSSTVELQIENVTEQNKTRYLIKMNVRNLASNASSDYTWMNSVHQRIELQDAKGNKYYSQGMNWENSSPAYLQATFIFGNNGNATLGPPAKLIYNHWSLMQHSVPFEFKDLTLP